MAAIKMTKALLEEYSPDSAILGSIARGKNSNWYYDPDTDTIKLFHNKAKVVFNQAHRIRMRTWAGKNADNKDDGNAGLDVVVDAEDGSEIKVLENKLTGNVDVWIEDATDLEKTDSADMLRQGFDMANAMNPGKRAFSGLQDWWANFKDRFGKWWWVLVIVILAIVGIGAYLILRPNPTKQMMELMMAKMAMG